MKLISKNKKNRGFTVVEALVAISILSLSILATYTTVQRSLQQSTMARDQIVAFYLAQEAMEYIKNVRDENALRSLDGSTPTHWLSGIAEISSDPCYFGKTCIIDAIYSTVTACSGGFGTCPNLRQLPGYNVIGHDATWTLTNFRREVQLQSINANEVKVVVRVTWTSRGVSKYLEDTEIIFNHQ